MKTAAFRLSVPVIWTVFFCFWTFKSVSQRVIRNTFAASITLPILPAGTIGIQPGFQYQFARRWAIVSELGIPVVRLAGADFEKVSLLRLQSELKYLTKPFNKQQGYLSLQAGYLFRRATNLDWGYYYDNLHPDDSVIQYSSAIVTSPVLFSAFKMGVEHHLRNHYFLDWSLGLGLRYINTHYAAQNPTPSSIVMKDATIENAL